jgi:hypothetical protein
MKGESKELQNCKTLEMNQGCNDNYTNIIMMI